MRFLQHSLLLAISFGAVFIWQQTLLSEFTIQSLALLVIVYLVGSWIKKKKQAHQPISDDSPPASAFGGSFEIVVLNTAILLLVFSTGNFSSGLFFLLYFLAFGVAFVFEPATVFVFVAATFLVFLPYALQDDVTGNFLRLGSLVLISPLAFFFGREYQKTVEQEEKIEELKEKAEEAAETISTDVEQVIDSEKEVAKSSDLDKLTEVLQETEKLKEESK